MKIAFHYHIPAIQKEDGIYLPGYLGVFLDGLSQYCTKIICYMHNPLKSEVAKLDYKLNSSKIELVNIGLHLGIFQRVLNSKNFVNIIEVDIKKRDVDLFLFRAPSPLLPAIALCCIKNNIKYSYLIVGDYVKNLKETKDVKPLKRFILNSFYKYNKHYQNKYAKNALIFTNNPLIYDEYKHLSTFEIRTTTLSEKDFFEKESFYENKNLSLLYAGRIEPSKGIEDILLATKFLKDDGINVVFNLVGWDASKGEVHLQYLKKKVKELALDDNFIFHGKKKVGDELFFMYRQSDIFISSTRGDEGFPRTIWEAMANSCPVIATKAGSIPMLLNNGVNAILIDKNSPQQMVKNIYELINNSSLVDKLRINAFELAKTNTTEKQSSIMIQKMKEYINECAKQS